MNFLDFRNKKYVVLYAPLVSCREATFWQLGCACAGNVGIVRVDKKIVDSVERLPLLGFNCIVDRV